MRAFLDAFSNMDPRFLGGNLKSDAPLPDTLLLATLDTPQGYFDCILSTEWADPVGFPPVNRGRLGGSGAITKSASRTPSEAPGTLNDLNFTPQRRCRCARAVRIAGNFGVRQPPPL